MVLTLNFKVKLLELLFLIAREADGEGRGKKGDGRDRGP